MRIPYKAAQYWVVVVLVVTALGFWPSFFSRFDTAPLAFHVHGITATAWIVVVGLQSWSIHHERRLWHRTVGKASLALFPLLAAGFIMIINVSASGYLDVDNVYYQQLGPSFAWGLGVAFFAYLWFYFQALRNRRDVNLHAAYMLSTLLLVWEAPVSRLILGFIPTMSVEGPSDFINISNAIIVAIAMAMAFAILLYLLDPARGGPFLLAALFMAVQIGGFWFLSDPESRSILFSAYAQLSPELTVGSAFALGSLTAWLGWRYPLRHSEYEPVDT